MKHQSVRIFLEKLIIIVLLVNPLFLNGQSAVFSYPDNSWDIETYVYLNIPSVEKTWEKAELKQFVKYMEKIYTADKWSLPRKNSPYSGSLFKKMTSRQLLLPINNKKIGLDKRIEYINTQLEYSNFLVAIYQEPNRPKERFATEVLAGYNFLLMSSNSVRGFMDELTQKLPANATAQPEFKKMYDQSTTQIVSLIDLHLRTLQEDWKRFGSDVFDDFSPATFSEIKHSWSLLSESQQQTLITQIVTLKKHKLKSIRKAAKGFLKEVN